VCLKPTRADGRGIALADFTIADLESVNSPYIHSVHEERDGRVEDHYVAGGESFHFVDGKLTKAAVTYSWDIGPTEDGPFVSFPCDTQKFHQVFGPATRLESIPVRAP
jgi:hypothetical protein